MYVPPEMFVSEVYFNLFIENLCSGFVVFDFDVLCINVHNNLA